MCLLHQFYKYINLTKSFSSKTAKPYLVFLSLNIGFLFKNRFILFSSCFFSDSFILFSFSLTSKNTIFSFSSV
ncbi:MAG: hypothetical protein Q8S84_05640 [bacterium]|nr:hypothetical protein [bacterium]